MRLLRKFLVPIFLSTSAFGATEAVLVQKVMNDKAIIIRANRQSYLIEKGIGCLSLGRFEGKVVYINSSGLFLGVGARLLLPDVKQECRIWDSKSLGSVNRSTPSVSSGQPSALSSSGTKCVDGHWIQEVIDNGKIIKLEDGSLWEVDAIDAITSSIWLPISDVLVCGSRIINVDEGEEVTAIPLSRIAAGSGTAHSGKREYRIQASADDETFVVNDEVFKAKTYCFNMEKGDNVIFLSGSPLGSCVSAELLNMRTNKVCKVWCE
ncbi:MAG: hypothetical protein HY316_08315 [Acidobacteria bacterium]|nr:hypothetical protein [Acidobacteriota bacterium]